VKNSELQIRQNDFQLVASYFTNIAIPLLTYWISLHDPIAGATAIAAGGSMNLAMGQILAHNQARVSEISEKVGIEKIKDLINGDERTRDTLMKTVRDLMVEESGRRRTILCNYLRNVHDFGVPQEDYTSKISVVINQMTFSELETLNLWNGRISEVIFEKNRNIYTSIQEAEQSIRESGMNERQLYFAYEDSKSQISVEEVIRNVRALGRTYGLLDVMDTQGVIGPTDGLRVKWLTPFGEVFLKYIQA